MELNTIPTIESLLEQNAIHFTGNPEWTYRFIDLVTPNNIASLFAMVDPMPRDSNLLAYWTL